MTGWTSRCMSPGGAIAACLWLLPRHEPLSPVEHASRSPTIRAGFVSLRSTAKRPETETDIDIIAVHGLDTKSPDTWTWVDRRNPKNRVNWLQDQHMLPSRVERVRIFTCHWPADLLQRSNLVQKTVEEYALLLFDGIQRRPLATNDHAGREERPILFLASCLGGIILMKALVHAKDKESSYYHLRRATRGIVFLATPFRGLRSKT